jgi:Zn-dependent protease with chaperone function
MLRQRCISANPPPAARPQDFDCFDHDPRCTENAYSGDTGCILRRHCRSSNGAPPDPTNDANAVLRMSTLPSRALACRVACVFACTVLGGCASGRYLDGSPLVAPTALSDVYSQANMQLRLATTANAQEGCAESECVERVVFDQRVARTGARLAAAAYQAYPELAERIAGFDFGVLDKAEPGTASTAGGYVAVLRPVSSIATADEALSFVMAREIGHVVAQHHERNTATSLVISVLTSVLAPFVNVAKLLALVYSGTTSAIASASVTVASFASSQVLIESYRPGQLEEADAIAMKLLSPLGYDARAVTAGFARADLQSPPTRWMRELQESVERLAAVDKGDAQFGLGDAAPHAAPVQAGYAQASPW